MATEGQLRTGLRTLHEHPSLSVAGLASALVTVLALAATFGWFVLLADSEVLRPGLVLLTGLLAYELVLVVGKPAVLPGTYALARDGPAPSLESAVRTMLDEGRAHYRPLLAASARARLAGVGYSLVLAPVVVAAVLVAATAVSAVLYATGAVQTPDPFTYATGLAVLGAVLWTVGKVVVALTEPLAIDGESPSTAWLASARLVRRRPRTAGRVAALRILLGAVPAAVLLVALLTVFEDQPGTLLAPIAVFALPAVLLKPLEGALTATGYDALDVSTPVVERSSWLPTLRPETLRPSARTVVAVVLVVALLVSTGAIRVTDARPNAEPESPATVDTEDAEQYYATARERTTASSRSVTTTVSGGNWSEADDPSAARLDPALRIRVAVDYAEREAAVEGWFGQDDGSWEPAGEGYLTDGLYASDRLRHSPLTTLHTRRTGNLTVSATPEYADVVDGLPVDDLPDDADGWVVRSRGNGTTVLEVDDPETVHRQSDWRGDSFEHRSGSRIRVRIDEATQRIERVTIRERYVRYESEERESVTERSVARTTVAYEYDDLGIERPDEVGTYLPGYLWDLVYY